MSEEATSSVEETPIVNDAITADDAGFDSAVDKQFTEEESSEEESEGIQAETTEELKEEIEGAIEEGASEEDVKEMIREFELKVNGKTVKRKVDLSDEENVKRILQREMAGQQAMQEAAELKKVYAEEIDRLKSDPWSVLNELGLDPNELAESRIKDQIEEMKKSPEQLENERIRKELEDLRKKNTEAEERAKQIEWSQMQQEAAVELETEIQTALDAYTALPQTPNVVQKIADHMLWAIENAEELGIDPDELKVTDVLPSVEQEYKRELNTLFDALGDEVFEEYIGKRNIERMRKKRLKAAKTTNTMTNVKETASKEPKKEAKEPIKARDYFKTL